MYHTTYRFFDAVFTVETDDPGFLAHFDRSYGRFQIPAEPAAPVYRVRLCERPELDLAGEVWRAADAAALRVFACTAILNAALAQVCSHFLFHAAALAAPDGTGVVIAGAAGLGKTTLTLALLHHGYRVFSDDVAAIGCEDGRLYPFPRPLAVWDALCCPGEKRLLDPADPQFADAAAVRPVPPRRLFLLTDGAGARWPEEWAVILDRLPDALLSDLADLPDVKAVRACRIGPYERVSLALADGPAPRLEQAVLTLCRRRGVLPLDIGPGPAGRPDFGRAPRREPLLTVEATEGLLRRLKSGAASALLQKRFGGSAARLFLALAGLADDMACYRLVVGRLEASVGLILAAGADDGRRRRAESAREMAV